MTSQPIKSDPLVHRVQSAGATIAVEEYGQDGPDHRAAIIFLPALGVPLSYYRPLFEHWAESGRHLFGVELRGGPQSPVTDLRRDTFGYSHLIRDDLPAVFGLEAVASAAEVVVIGHSLGGQLALLAAASGAVKASAVVTIATGTSSAASQRNRPARLRRQVGVRFIHTVVGVLGYWPGHRLGFGGRQPKLLMRDWTYEGRHGRYQLTGDPTDYEAALATLSPPTLLVALAGDPMMPAAGVDHLAARLPAEVERAQIDTGLARDHFLWARRNPAPVVTEIEGWLGRIGL